MSSMTITQGSAGDLDSLEPLWVAVHRHHRASMPLLAPYVSDELTWQRRVATYRALFDRYTPSLLLARSGSELIGYGIAYATAAQDTWLADTWETGDLIGEIESLAVLPGHRGQGVGSRLLEALHEQLTELGVRDIVLGVLPGNHDAVRLYERHGYTPTWLYLSRLNGRQRSPDT